MEVERRRRIEDHLDKGVGMAWMKDHRIARLVQNALLYFDGVHYRLPAWVVMPNHVHVLVIPKSGFSLAEIVHSWKSFISNEANKLLGRRGRFWQEEYFDRYVRNAHHYANAINYIENNPVKACLCSHRAEWEFSSARMRMARAAN